LPDTTLLPLAPSPPALIPGPQPISCAPHVNKSFEKFVQYSEAVTAEEIRDAFPEGSEAVQ
jgi:hypothetical protein